jgi:diaminopimelate epimerase
VAIFGTARWSKELKSSPFSLSFTKLHGLGNDFILIDGTDLQSSKTGKSFLTHWHDCAQPLAKFLCDRRFGIGADGLILGLNMREVEQRRIAQSLYANRFYSADLAWTYTNGDGSPSDMCGNGLRCLALWAKKTGLVEDTCTILTAFGLVQVKLHLPEIEIHLGEPKLAPAQIPFVGAGVAKNVVQYPFTVGDQSFNITCVNVGNPHCVIFANGNLDKHRVHLPIIAGENMSFFPEELSRIAREIQESKNFPESTNVEFVWQQSPTSVETIVYERGMGATLACGSAAMAVVVAGVLEERLAREAQVTLPGGTLTINWMEKDNKISMRGLAECVFSGRIELPEMLIGLCTRESIAGVSQ